MGKRKAAGHVPKKSRVESVPSKYFIVERGGKQKRYAIQGGFGYLIRSFRRASDLVQVGELIEAGLPAKEIEPVIKYLDLKVPEIARTAAVSPSTVSRWKEDSSIGSPGSNQFFRIDEVIRKGVDLFGGLEEFKDWLRSPNLALGNNTPAKLITSQIGVEMVDEALDALLYGNVMQGMRCYRIMSEGYHKHPYTSSANAARWNPKGMRMIYASSSPSMASLEYLCIKGSAVATRPWHMVIYEIVDETLIGTMDKRSLPAEWNVLPHGKATQDFGREWLEERVYPFLKVPSARIDIAFYPLEFNVLINPDFPELTSLLRVVDSKPFNYLLNPSKI